MKTWNEQDLLQKKKEIDKTKTELSELKGQETILFQQLQETFGCKSLKEAKTLIEKYKTDISELDSEIESKTKELQEKYFEEED